MIGAASVKVLPHHGMDGAKEGGRPVNNKLLLFYGSAVERDNNIKKDCQHWKAGRDKCSAVLQKFSRTQKAVREQNSVRETADRLSITLPLKAVIQEEVKI